MYIDPGFGSLLFQAAAAIVAVCGAYFAATKGWFRKLFSKKNTPKPEETAAEEKPEKDSGTDSDGFLK